MKLGLALSGGGIRGVAHVGVLKALNENNISIDVIGGTSSGSMVAALYSMGYSASQIYDLCKKYSKTIVKLNSSVIRKEIKNFILYRKISSQGVNNGEFIQKIFNNFAQEKGIKLIEDIEMPIVIPSVDIMASKKNVFTSVKKSEKKYIYNIDVGRAVQASCSFPLAFAPLKINKKLYLDGGIVDNIPVNEVKKIGADKIIAVKFNSDKIHEKSNAIDIIMRVADIMGEQIAEDNLKKADYIIEIPTDGTGIFDVNKIDFCFESGYNTAMKQIDKIKDKINKL